MKRYGSLRWKLAGLIAGGSVLTAVIAAAGFAWFDLQRFWANTNAETVAIADVIGDQIGPALALGDRKAAGEILNALRSDTLIRDASLYDDRSACFAAFRRAGGRGCPIRPQDGLHNATDAIVYARPVQGGGERFGTLALSAGVPSVASVVFHYLGGAALILLLSLVVAAAAAMTLQAHVSRPILAMAQFAERVASTHRFKDRVPVQSSDELGVLVESFNAMLGEIERRDELLSRHRRSLEDEIAERKRVNAELRIAKEKAEEAARLKSEFLANMSHEIRTPMNGVIGMISLVLDRSTDPAEREHLQVAQDAAQSLVNILNDILDLAKVEAGKMTLETIDFELETVVRTALRIFDIGIRDKGLGLDVSIAPECPRIVSGDPARLRQIILNLVGNAVKFTREGGVRISVEPVAVPATTVGNALRFEVSDTGIGIPAAKLNSIFDAFTQADGSHTRRFGGTGLGLAITRRLAELMGGRLWATSVNGRGSSFFVDLPLNGTAVQGMGLPAAGVETGDRPQPPHASRALPLLRVLVAEDNMINQKVVSAMLARQGWLVTLAANGREAVEHFQTDTYDLVLMDIQMPEMDGMEATRRIRRQEKLRDSGGGSSHIPIIALTANALRPQHEQCLAEGIDAVLTKPINLKSLLDAVAAAVGCAEGCGQAGAG